MSVSLSSTYPSFQLSETEAAAEFYRANGFAVYASVFTPDDIRAAQRACDRIKVGIESEQLRNRGNFMTFRDQDSGLARASFWVSMQEEYLDQMRIDQRLLSILTPLIGQDIRQLTNSLHWKPPGTSVSISFHTDRVNRKPDEHFRDLADSFVQLGIAIDPMTDTNGPLLIIPRSHLSQEEMREDAGNYNNGHPSRAILAERGYGEDDLVAITGNPGDVVIWHPDTIHGSDQNTADIDRCMYINGYIKAQSTWRGNWAFVKGHGVPVPPIDVPAAISPNSIDEDWQRRFPL